jgi:hypothetical protein
MACSKAVVDRGDINCFFLAGSRTLLFDSSACASLPLPSLLRGNLASGLRIRSCGTKLTLYNGGTRRHGEPRLASSTPLGLLPNDSGSLLQLGWFSNTETPDSQTTTSVSTFLPGRRPMRREEDNFIRRKLPGYRD